MIELGASGTYIYITDDEGLNGQSPQYLRKIRGEILAGTEPVQEMVDALDVVLANPKPENDPVEQLRGLGQFLLGINEYAHPGQETVDGLLFAQCEDMLESGAFSIVRVATWIRQARQHSSTTGQELANELTELGLSDVHSDDVGSYGPWGIPVERTTRIVPLHPTGSERPEGYIYGHRKDFEAIERLSLPDDLRRVFADVAASWHGAELEGDASALADGIRATLDGWKLPTLPLDQ
ncbi:hypothetical protein KBD20_00665 [Candidatus Saccharibacteria bacterium]|nr:hypothetical protein [Candidatus Saccharibacteria bacterium]